MNQTATGVVTKVLTPPRFNEKYERHGVTFWEVQVEYATDGVTSTMWISFPTEEQANKIDEGFIFEG